MLHDTEEILFFFPRKTIIIIRRIILERVI